MLSRGGVDSIVLKRLKLSFFFLYFMCFLGVLGSFPSAWGYTLFRAKVGQFTFDANFALLFEYEYPVPRSAGGNVYNFFYEGNFGTGYTWRKRIFGINFTANLTYRGKFLYRGKNIPFISAFREGQDLLDMQYKDEWEYQVIFPRFGKFLYDSESLVYRREIDTRKIGRVSFRYEDIPPNTYDKWVKEGLYSAGEDTYKFSTIGLLSAGFTLNYLPQYCKIGKNKRIAGEDPPTQEIVRCHRGLFLRMENLQHNFLLDDKVYDEEDLRQSLLATEEDEDKEPSVQRLYGWVSPLYYPVSLFVGYQVDGAFKRKTAKGRILVLNYRKYLYNYDLRLDVRYAYAKDLREITDRKVFYVKVDKGNYTLFLTHIRQDLMHRYWGGVVTKVRGWDVKFFYGRVKRFIDYDTLLFQANLGTHYGDERDSVRNDVGTEPYTFTDLTEFAARRNKLTVLGRFTVEGKGVLMKSFSDMLGISNRTYTNWLGYISFNWQLPSHWEVAQVFSTVKVEVASAPRLLLLPSNEVASRIHSYQILVGNARKIRIPFRVTVKWNLYYISKYMDISREKVTYPAYITLTRRDGRDGAGYDRLEKKIDRGFRIALSVNF